MLRRSLSICIPGSSPSFPSMILPSLKTLLRGSRVLRFGSLRGRLVMKAGGQVLGPRHERGEGCGIREIAIREWFQTAFEVIKGF